MANGDNKNGNGGMKWPPKVGQGVKLWASGKEPRDERQAQAIQAGLVFAPAGVAFSASASGVAIIGALFFAAIPDLRDTGDYAVGMTWATAANFALVLLVTSQIRRVTQADPK
ncbi:hypothetical protein GL267_000300 [Acidithiobacillus ferrianus]|uniref:Uncharacterized protein n=2 Tax=Acidithiobacillus ferrianus TaxID=2678518 RepID=A0A845U5C9_9PROT|nr:hypothetical protein [Acidithiobacillus ferrianus]NDU41389.1 hypothetical protein [Acidithiobacillus ferrianus]